MKFTISESMIDHIIQRGDRPIEYKNEILGLALEVKDGMIFLDTATMPFRRLAAKYKDHKKLGINPKDKIKIESQVQMEVDGPKLWTKLHERPKSWTSAYDEIIWLEDFKRRIPCGICKAHWIELITKYPVDLSSPLAYAKWGFDQHNRINERLGKSLFSYSDAEKHWGFKELA